MEPCTTATEAIQPALDDEGDVAVLAKLLASKDVDFFSGFAVEECVSNVCCTDFEVVHRCDHETQSNGHKIDNARVNIFFGRVGMVPPGDETCFLTEVEFDIEDKVVWDALVP